MDRMNPVAALVSWTILSFLVSVTQVAAQQRVPQPATDGRLGYERLVAVVPMVGEGTYEDPRRPAYVPDYLLRGNEQQFQGRSEAEVSPLAEALARGETPKVIVGFHYELSDGEQFALVEFQATDRTAFEPLFEAAKRPFASVDAGTNRNALEGGFDLKVFEVGKTRRVDIETELRKHKREFSLETFVAKQITASDSGREAQ